MLVFKYVPVLGSLTVLATKQRTFEHYNFFSDGTWADEKCFDPEGGVPFEQSAAFLVHNLQENDTLTPVEA